MECDVPMASQRPEDVLVSPYWDWTTYTVSQTHKCEPFPSVKTQHVASVALTEILKWRNGDRTEGTHGLGISMWM